MITLYESVAGAQALEDADFTTLGMAVLKPSSCTVSEIAGGMYELELVHPITDDGKAALLRCGRIIKAPVPVRESPEIEYDVGGGGSQTVTRHIYKSVVNGRLYIRNAPNGTKIGYLTNGQEVQKISETGTAATGIWYRVATMDGGITGYVYPNVNQSPHYMEDTGRTVTVTIGTDDPQHVITKLTLSKTQLFRIYQVEKNAADRSVTARAQHITYDLMGSYSLGATGGVVGRTASVAQHLINFRDQTLFSFDAGIALTSYGFTDNIKMEYQDKNVIELLYGESASIYAATGCRVIRDNFNVYLLPAGERRLGFEIRYGKNLLEANLVTDISDIATAVIGKGRNGDGQTIYCEPQYRTPTAEHPDMRDTYGTITKIIEYSDTTLTAGLRTRAKAEFTENNIDEPKVTLDAEFVALELAPRYAELANQYSMHMYDSVRVYDPDAGIDLYVAMTEYTFDVLSQKYISVTLGEPKEINL